MVHGYAMVQAYTGYTGADAVHVKFRPLDVGGYIRVSARKGKINYTWVSGDGSMPVLPVLSCIASGQGKRPEFASRHRNL